MKRQLMNYLCCPECEGNLPEGEIFCWVYGYSSIVPLLNSMRNITLKLPISVVKFLSLFPAGVIFTTNTFYRLISRFPFCKNWGEKNPFHIYFERGFMNIHITIFDHLTVPIINYYTEPDLGRFFQDTRLTNIQISHRFSGKKGQSWRFSGTLPREIKDGKQ